MNAFTRGELFVIALIAVLAIACVALAVVDQVQYIQFNEGCQLRGGFTIRASDGYRRCAQEVGK